jgi:NAD(P)H-nitrite reductase large subunit
MMNVVLWVKLNHVQRLVPAVTEIFQAEMKALDHVVTNALCHFNLTRVELFQAIKIKKLVNFKDGKSGTLGCEICKPAVASILSWTPLTRHE